MAALSATYGYARSAVFSRFHFSRLSLLPGRPAFLAVVPIEVACTQGYADLCCLPGILEKPLRLFKGTFPRRSFQRIISVCAG